MMSRPRRAPFLFLVLATAACSGGSGGGTDELPVTRDVFVIPGKDVPFTIDITYDTGLPVDPGTTPDGVVVTDAPIDVPDAADGIATDNTPTEVVVHPDPGADACVPDCEDKNCGPDGCGGKCGPDCESPWFCQIGKCACTTTCGSVECGEDGCGGMCSAKMNPCDVCSPKGRCMTGACSSVNDLTCAGDNSGGSGKNDISGNTNRLAVYASCSGNSFWGPEKAYRFVATGSGVLTLDFSASSFSSDDENARIFLLEDTGNGCSSQGCLAVSDKTLSREVSAGKTYYVVVDSLLWDDSFSYSFSVDCSWYVPPVDK